ncbi:phage terminase large subunit family protein [Aurantimonas sp. C2-5-R2]|nr:phage terminase large subunit family protein [Aurantimonas sp. C2-3-R2]
MKAAQVGATEAGNCFIGYCIHHAPGPMLAVQPTRSLASAGPGLSRRPPGKKPCCLRQARLPPPVSARHR